MPTQIRVICYFELHLFIKTKDKDYFRGNPPLKSMIYTVNMYMYLVKVLGTLNHSLFLEKVSASSFDGLSVILITDFKGTVL